MKNHLKGGKVECHQTEKGVASKEDIEKLRREIAVLQKKSIFEMDGILGKAIDLLLITFILKEIFANFSYLGKYF